MRSLLVGSALVAALALFSPRSSYAQAAPAKAARAGEDTITLKDGSVLRGTLTEIAKGDHVSLLLSTAQTARVRWDAIVKVERAGVAIDLVNVQPTVPPQPAAVSATPAPPAEKNEGSVRVHIDATRDVELEVDAGGTLNWEVVCTSPCDRELPLGRVYRLNGSGMRKTTAFMLQGKPGSSVSLEVDHGTTAGYVGGIVMTSIGSPVVFVGLMITLVGAAAGSNSLIDGGAILKAGLITTGVGAGLMIPGIVLIANNSKTTLKQHEGGRSLVGSSPFLSASAPSKSPIWTAVEGPRVPDAPSFNLLSGSF